MLTYNLFGIVREVKRFDLKLSDIAASYVYHIEFEVKISLTSKYNLLHERAVPFDGVLNIVVFKLQVKKSEQQTISLAISGINC